MLVNFVALLDSSGHSYGWGLVVEVRKPWGYSKYILLRTIEWKWYFASENTPGWFVMLKLQQLTCFPLMMPHLSLYQSNETNAGASDWPK